MFVWWREGNEKVVRGGEKVRSMEAEDWKDCSLESLYAEFEMWRDVKRGGV